MGPQIVRTLLPAGMASMLMTQAVSVVVRPVAPVGADGMGPFCETFAGAVGLTKTQNLGSAA